MTRYEWAPAQPMQIFGYQELQQMSEDIIDDQMMGVALDTGSNGVLIYGERDTLIGMAENLVLRLQALPH